MAPRLGEFGPNTHRIVSLLQAKDSFGEWAYTYREIVHMVFDETDGVHDITTQYVGVVAKRFGLTRKLKGR